MTSRDDAVRAAVTPMLAELRGELLVLPDEHIVDRHLDMMAFERQVLATPRFVEKKKTRRAPVPTPRRAAVAFVCVIATLASCGLSAAGALPEPLQNITESIAHTFGVPHTDHSQGAAHTPSAGAIATPRPAPAPAPKAATTSPTPAVVHHPTVSTTAPTTTTSAPPALPGSGTQIAKTPAHPPAKSITPIDSGPPPSTNSSNIPPGYPVDWRDRATEAAALGLQACAKSAGAEQAGCPQSAVPVGANAEVASISWTLLNVPEDGAAVIAKTQHANPSKHIPLSTTVTVYEAFQMSATYTEADGTGPYLAYSGGVGVATMTWNGTSFANVTFSPGSVAGQLPVGVIAPTIPQPTNVDNGAVLGALQAGFAACTTTPPVAGDPVASCPQPVTAGATWTSVGNPTDNAVVAYDAKTGLYTVTGTYAMTSDQGTSVTGPYTATLFFDNFQVRVLSISTS
jgi:hypothetical protein